MDIKTQEKLRKIMLDDFGGSRGSSTFSKFTDEEYIGYITAVVKLQNLNLDASVLEMLTMARELQSCRLL